MPDEVPLAGRCALRVSGFVLDPTGEELRARHDAGLVGRNAHGVSTPSGTTDPERGVRGSARARPQPPTLTSYMVGHSFPVSRKVPRSGS